MKTFLIPQNVPGVSQVQKPKKRIHTAITLHKDVVVKLDAECDAKKGQYEYAVSRSDVVEDALRGRYRMEKVEMGRKKKPVDVPEQKVGVQEQPEQPDSNA